MPAPGSRMARTDGRRADREDEPREALPVTFDASMPRPPRMTDDRQQRLTRLLGKQNLTPLERGELAALGRDGSAQEQEQVRARLAGRRGPSAKQVGDAIIRALDEGA